MKCFLLIVFISCSMGYTSAQVTTQDSLALVSLYNSTNGGAWTNRTNWLQPALVGSWYGITVSGGRVTEINLPGNNLTGPLPDLSALTALTRLDLQNNFIGNTIPATMNSLTALLHLNLRNNRFSGLIPNLSGLSNLKYFSIGSNNFLQFAQPIPAFVVGLTQLEYLGLDNNRLSGVIPAGFSNLTLLKEITVATASSLTPSNEFIAELATIQALERITLMNLNLGGFQINLAPLGGLTNLEFLDIRSTNTNTLPPPNVWVSDSLTVDISTNALDFGDLEPLQGITQPTFVNTGQALLLFSTINPTTATLVEGDPFELQTSFGGTQNNYVWQKGGVPIPGQTGSALNLDSIESAEAGVYRLVMTSNLVTGLTLSTTNITLVVVPRVQSRFAIQQHLPLTQEIGANSYGGYWADTDRDGDEDLLVNNAFDTNPNFLYQNNGDGTFTKVTSGDIVTVRDPGRYVSWGDYDNNGYPDLFASDYTGADNVSSLYQNNGNGTFNRIPFNHNADGGLWADYDNDGDLDLSVMTTSSTPVNNRIYKNMGNGSFEVIDNFVPFTSTWVAGWVDMDNDNDLDYFLTDGNVNPSNIRLFKNTSGVFTAYTLPLPTGNFFVRAISWADIDGDGDQDFFAENSNGNINSTAESQFYINDGTGQFTRENASLRMGGLRVTGARGTVFGDADNDGDLDLFVNHKYLSTSNDLTVQLFLNNGSGSFTVVPVTEQSFGFSDFGTNMSLADYNNDGFLDLFIANFDILIPNRLCRNLQSGNGNHWIKLRLEGTVSNRSAIGARVDIFSGGNRRTRQVLSSSGLSGQNSLLVHSGLGSATQADSVVIHWPSGIVQRFNNLNADQTIAIEEATGTPEQNSSNIVFSNVTTNSMHVAFKPGTGTSRLVFARPLSAVSFQPADSTTYTLGQLLDSATFIMYIGDSTNFDVTGLQADTEYFLEFFEVNLVRGYPKYKRPGATATQRTLPAALSQFITSTPIPFKVVGEAPFALQATSTSGLPVQFTSSDSTVATITNNMVWVWGPGTATITMSQPGNSTYSPAPETSQELTVYPAGDLGKRLVTTTHLGAAQNHGAIISVGTDGSNYQLLHVFDSIQGQRPTGQLLQVGEFLYGTASRGGAFDAGTIYRIKQDGSEFQTLHVFDATNGKEPFGGLIQASDGDLYGATASGGTVNFGTVYKISPNGTGFTKLYEFIDENQGYNPYGRLLQGSNGYLYGTTVGGGTNLLGTIFRIRTNGTGFEVLHSFHDTEGTSPYGGLYQAANGKLYGGANGGGDNGLWTGAIFRIELDGTGYTKLYDFGTGENGRNAFYGGVMTQGRDGSLFGTTHTGGTGGGGTVFRLSNDSTFVNLRNFGGIYGSGAVGSAVVGPDANLYGLTLYGGDNGLGVLFKLSQEGNEFNKVLDMTTEIGSYPFLTSPTLVYSPKQTQTITFGALPEAELGNTPAALTATASSGLPVSYTSSNTAVAYVQSDTLFVVGAGSTLITARQPGNNFYLPADSVSQLFTVIDNVIRPTIPSSNLVFTNVFSTQMNVSFTPGNGEKHLVVMKAGAPVTWTPMDGAPYAGNSDFASAFDPESDGTKIVSADSATSIAVTGLVPGMLIHVRVFEYSGNNYTKYLVASSLSGSRATLALPNVYVVTPADGATGINVTTNVTARALSGATTYTIQLSPYADFGGDVLERSGARNQNFTSLAYDSVYYSRVKTDLSPDFGVTKSFRTGPPEQFSYMTSPANNATGVPLNALSRIITLNNVIGATTYTCELNTSPNFDGISQVRSGARTLTFTGLSPGTTYYSRVRTNLSPNWGQTRQFTTASAALLTYVTSPANNAVNVSYLPNVTVTDVGAASYTVQLSPDPNFDLDVLEQTSPARTMNFSGLSYSTLYYSRARTDLDPNWGPTRMFTTTTPLAFSYVTSPANNAVNVNYVVNISSLTVPGATTYTIEANTSSDFTGTSIVRSGGRTLNFTLDPSQTYFVRVSTDLLPGQWGVTRSFTTNSSLAYSYITSPANGAINVPYVTNIIAYNVPLATSYIIEANTLPDFTGTSIVKMGTGRTYSFTLAYDQVYHVRVQTNLAPGQWGQTRSFTTGSPQSLAYVTSPANGVVGVPTTVNVTSNPVPGATAYTIELNTNDTFTGIPIVRSGTGRTKNFTGLAEATTYYARVSTNLSPGLWGPTRSFTTVNPFGRQAGEAWVESTDEDPVVADEITEVRLFPNPFSDQFEVHVQTADQQPLEAQLIDMNGRTLFQSNGWMTNRMHSVKGDFSPGVYLLDLRTNGARTVVRIVRK